MPKGIRVDWSIELLKYWKDVLQVMKEQRFQITLLFSWKISAIVEGEIKFSLINVGQSNLWQVTQLHKEY